ncbi:hypothetical protein GCM10011579_006520 [Streptomyces albiflavescens]|uniref:Uncharacterized protein n=1 Tax=Streptomyces albiflavescens TaxID=1623582 RepID=A0A917XRZ4_9ACTN|nr:hypothetical protein GCM10011579_006520 [Streptomyces albiflavescens]
MSPYQLPRGGRVMTGSRRLLTVWPCHPYRLSPLGRRETRRLLEVVVLALRPEATDLHPAATVRRPAATVPLLMATVRPRRAVVGLPDRGTGAGSRRLLDHPAGPVAIEVEGGAAAPCSSCSP